MKVWNEDLCIVCFENKFTVTHHTSYKQDETVRLCESCHGKVHFKDGFYDHLEPEITREEAERRDDIEVSSFCSFREFSFKVTDSKLSKRIDDLINRDKYKDKNRCFVVAMKNQIERHNIELAKRKLDRDVRV